MERRICRGSTADNDGVMGRVVDAKRRINAAMAILGKIAGDAIWFVIGEDMSLREFAQRQAANGRTISVNEVKGRVISGLDILADHYRILYSLTISSSPTAPGCFTTMK